MIYGLVYLNKYRKICAHPLSARAFFSTKAAACVDEIKGFRVGRTTAARHPVTPGRHRLSCDAVRDAEVRPRNNQMQEGKKL